MSLMQQQSRFMGRILDDDTADLSPGEAVYHFAYRNRLQEALAENFERVAVWLGDDAFAVAATTHMRRRPPSSWTLDAFGEGFDDTLAALYPADPEVAELAWLDWGLRCAFAGPDAAPFDPAGLAAVDWAVARLLPDPNLRLRPLTTNAVAIWQAMARGETPPAVQRLAEGAGLAVWRQGLEPMFRTLDAAEYAAVRSMAEGLSFAGICAGLEGEAAAETAAGWLGEWLQSGLVRGVT